MAMKVMILNGSSHVNGTTMQYIKAMEEVFHANGVGTEVWQLGGKPVADCLQCNFCATHGKCVLTEDGLNDFVAKARECDGFIFASPVYYAHPSGRIQAFLDRAFYSASDAFQFKPGASFSVARRGGTVSSFDVLNKYFGISAMPVAASTYWNEGHGMVAADAEHDEEGMQTARNLARHMTWMMQCFAAGKAAGVPLPEMEHSKRTDFIR
jgi:multimeric flavodoxin WrbA